MVLNTGKDGALIAVDEKLFHTGIQRAIKSTSRQQQKWPRMYISHAPGLRGREGVKTLNSQGKGKATK